MSRVEAPGRIRRRADAGCQNVRIAVFSDIRGIHLDSAACRNGKTAFRHTRNSGEPLRLQSGTIHNLCRTFVRVRAHERQHG